ncbi:hypothetical protein Tco_0474920 [Tanacetum coccineum]
MLDSYTCMMCEDSWGYNSYARTMLELNFEKDLMNALVVAIPLLEEASYMKETIRVEYEWFPLRSDDGFQQVYKRRGQDITEVDSNTSLCDKGSRIILGWDPDHVDIIIVSQMDQVFTEALGEFKEASGMIPGIHKSMAYFYNLVNHVEMWILSLMPFKEGTLPVSYLGVPLISSRLLYKDCKVHVD